MPILDSNRLLHSEQVAKRKVANLEEEKKALLKEHKILKSKKKSVSYLS